MNPRKKLLERIGLQAEPETVERASRKERVRRQLWMLISTLISSLLALIIISLAGIALPPWLLEATLSASIFLLVFLSLTFWIDLKVFSWGVHQFDLVAPWQFREEKSK